MHSLVKLLVVGLLGFSNVSKAFDYLIVRTKVPGFKGDMNGFTGANELCQDPDNTDGNPNFIAFLKGNPSLTDLDTVHNFYNFDGEKVVSSSINDIFGANPPVNLAPIMDVTGHNDDSHVWTGANGDDCNGWTEGSGSAGGFGKSQFIGTSEWINDDSINCSALGKIYCIRKIATVNGDPHFVGFDGCKFDFDGQDGDVFAIYSDKFLQINALFQTLAVDTNDGNWMTKLGIHTDENTFILDPAIGLMNGNGTILTTDGTVRFGNDLISLTFYRHLVSSFTITNPLMFMKAEVKRFRADRDDFFINLTFELRSNPIAPHGVLGQTARFIARGKTSGSAAAGNCVGVEGQMENYIVNDGILGTDFTFSTFGRDNYRNTNNGYVPIRERSEMNEFVPIGSRAMMMK